jgi:hypothetical protein
MLVMNKPVSQPVATNPRRFLLLPEDSVKRLGARPPIRRRYRLASVARRSELSETDLATAGLVRDLGRMGRMR